mmetsp:Transcript_940/g.1991  ORF Transcript_940/g.1991 Transcript_940/m.1991 type:complete len:598 (+) Transcript_940:52-1845(+)
MADPIESLRSLASSGAVTSGTTLDQTAKTLTIRDADSSGSSSSGAESHDATTKYDLILPGGKTLSYPLGALYLLLIQKPSDSYVTYRSSCKKLGVEAVKVTEKKDVVAYFFGSAEAAAAAAASGDKAVEQEADEKDDKLDRDRDRDRDRRRRDKDSKEERRSGSRRDGKESSSARKERKRREAEAAAEAAAELRRSKKEKARAGMTNEQLMEGLDVVVDKRDGALGGELDKDEDGDDNAAGGAGGAAGDKDHDSVAALDDEDEAVDSTAAAVTAEEEEAERRQHAAIIASLSSEGFEVRDLDDAAIDADRPTVERITSLEIPVGNSASVLRCGAGVGDARRDFSRVLDLYLDTVRAEKDAAGYSGSGGDRKRPSSSSLSSSGRKDPKRSRHGTSGGGGSSGAAGNGRTPAKKPRPPNGPPIIVVPNAMTSPITLVNAADFFGSAQFVPRDVALKKAGGNASQLRKRGASVTVTHKVAPRLGGGEIEFEIVDNPSTKLQSPRDWDRVVAVVAQGAEWQFKSWQYSRPVDLFGRCFGFYIGIEGAPVPKELLQWNVKLGKVNRDKRGLDSVTYADFWNGLSEWMHVHKPEYLKMQQEEA